MAQAERNFVARGRAEGNYVTAFLHRSKGLVKSGRTYMIDRNIRHRSGSYSLHRLEKILFCVIDDMVGAQLFRLRDLPVISHRGDDRGVK